MAKVKIICVNGFSRSGKDSFIAAVQKKVPVSEIHSTIDTVRNALAVTYMMDTTKKGPKERSFLMTVKKAWIDYNNGPLKEVVERVRQLELTYAYMNNVKEVLLFVQIREPQELYKIHTHFIANSSFVLVERPDILPQPGDEEVLDFDYEYEVLNNGTLEDLNNEATKFIQYLKGV